MISSKPNLLTMNKGFGAANGVGIILDLENQVKITYSWGIEENTNNIAEVVSLWQGISQILSHNIKEEMVFSGALA